MSKLSADDVFSILQPRLRKELPGHKAHVRMAPFHRKETALHGVYNRKCRQAGVLALLQWSNEPRVVLTVRNKKLNNHGGQISFPGGKCEDGETHVQAAMREAAEEVGALPSSFKLAGALTPLYIPPSDFCVHPFVAVTDADIDWHRDEQEVASIEHASLRELAREANIKKAERQIRDLKVIVPFYHTNGLEIWGATAMMLAELLEILQNEDLL